MTEACCIYGEECIGVVDCDSTLTRYCSSGDNFSKKKVCTDWELNDVKGAADALMTSRCKTAADLQNNPVCIAWCTKHGGKCDTAAAEFCKRPANLTSAFCACVSPVIPAVARDLARCVWNPCKTAADPYLTKKMTEPCPDIIDCRQIVDLRGASSNIIIDNKMVQACSNNSTLPIEPAPAPEPRPIPYATVAGVLFLIFVIVVAVIVAVILTHKPAPSQKRGGCDACA